MFLSEHMVSCFGRWGSNFLRIQAIIFILKFFYENGGCVKFKGVITDFVERN